MSTSLVWPASIMNPSDDFGKDYEDNSIKSNYEDGSVQSRVKFTRSRDIFTLKWPKMPDAQFTVFDDFVKNQAKFSANTFLWTNPKTAVQAEVRIYEKPTAKVSGYKRWNVELKLQEV